jgi:short-chain fatty acids transporter
MIARLGDACARWAERWVPHPFVFALALTGVVLVAGLASWPQPETPRVRGLLAAWYEGFWSTGLLAFGFQMALILVTGYALADAPLVRRALARLGDAWRTPAQAAALVTAVAIALSWIHWGLGLVGGAFLAREVGRASRRSGRPLPYPLIVAGAYVGFLAWHAGLSGSAPLVVAQSDHPQVDLVGSIPVATTIFSLPNLLLTGALLLWLPAAMALMARNAPASTPPAFDEHEAPEESDESSPDLTPATRLGRSRVVAAIALVPAAGVLALVLVPGWTDGSRGLDLDTVLFLFLLGSLALHGSAGALARSMSRGAAEAGGILLQFPFYFALLGAMRESGLITILANASVRAARFAGELGLSPAWAFQTLTFMSAGLVNLFVPSGGGQWAVQGDIVLSGALDPAVGLEPARAVMALAYGDAWTNMLQPFWALALLSVTHMRARQIMGYTLAAMLLALPLYLLVFAL